MTVHDAEPADIYVDAQGKLWRCIGVCREPTVIMEEVEGRTPNPPNWNNAAAVGVAQAIYQGPQKVQIIKARQSGGVGGLMWEGWKRIFRSGETP